MPMLGFFPWKARLILLEDILRTTREAKCYNKECPFDKNTCDYAQMNECYKPRIQVGDIVKLYTGLYHRDYCKILEIHYKMMQNQQCPAMIEECTHLCIHRGALHFQTWEIIEIITKRYKDFTEEDWKKDGFIFHPIEEWDCEICPAQKKCKLEIEDISKCTAAFQADLFFSRYKPAPDDVFDVYIGRKLNRDGTDIEIDPEEEDEERTIVITPATSNTEQNSEKENTHIKEREQIIVKEEKPENTGSFDLDGLTLKESK